MSIPIVLCGKSGSRGESAVEALKPDYEVVKYITGHAAAISEIPALLQGANKPKAIVVGKGFDENVKSEIEKASGGVAVQWLLPDASKDSDDDAAVIARGKAALDKLKADGKLDGSASEIHQF